MAAIASAPRLHALPILQAAVRTYRRQFGAILLLGLIVVAPLAVLDGLVSQLADRYTDAIHGWLQVGLSAATVVDLGAGIAALTFIAGFLDKLAAADRGGHRRPTLRDTARALPRRRLIVANLLVWGLSAVATIALVLPGLLVFTLLCATGPVVIIEGRGSWRALLRSAALVWPHLLLAFVLVTVPTIAEEALSDFVLEAQFLTDFPYAMLADIVLTVVVTSAVGVLEVTMAHALIAHDSRRRLPGGG